MVASSEKFTERIAYHSTGLQQAVSRVADESVELYWRDELMRVSMQQGRSFILIRKQATPRCLGVGN